MTDKDKQTILHALYVSRDVFLQHEREMRKCGQTRVADQFQAQANENERIIAEMEQVVEAMEGRR